MVMIKYNNDHVFREFLRKRFTIYNVNCKVKFANVDVLFIFFHVKYITYIP